MFLAVFLLAMFPGTAGSAPPPAAADTPKTPKLATVTPEEGPRAASYTAAGENLGKDQVGGLYLTDASGDIQTEIVEQKVESIQFKVPAKTKAGRYSLMLLTADGKKFLEQPVKLTITE